MTRYHLLLTPAWLVSLTWLAACEAAPTDTTVVTDSAGVRLVMNVGEDLPLDLGLTPVRRLGGEQAGPEAFYEAGPGTVGTDSQGNIYVLDRAAHRVVVFDSTGRHLRTMGREGKGPGELSSPHNLTVRDDGTALVNDIGKGTLVGFSPTGEPLPDEERVHALERHVWVGTAFYTVARDFGPDGLVEQLLYVVGGDSTELAGFEREPGRPIELESCGMGFSGMPPVFAPYMEWDAGAGGVVMRGGSAYAISVFREGRLVARYRRDVAPEETTLDLAMRELGDAMIVMTDAGEVRCDPAEVVEQRGLAPVVPAIRDLRIAPDGTIWVSRGGPRPEPTPTDILAPDGTYLGTLPAEVPFPIGFLPDGRPFMTETDDVGVTRLVVYGMQKVPSGFEPE